MVEEDGKEGAGMKKRLVDVTHKHKLMIQFVLGNKSGDPFAKKNQKNDVS